VGRASGSRDDGESRPPSNEHITQDIDQADGGTPTAVIVAVPAGFVDLALLCLRVMVAAIFFASGLRHARDPVARGKSIGMSPAFTWALGVVQMAAAAALAVGLLTQVAALVLIVVMLGAIQKKIFEWHTGFWGEKESGWHYDLMLVTMNLVIFATAGGRYVIF
jgi:putative oxidoreductase